MCDFVSYERFLGRWQKKYANAARRFFFRDGVVAEAGQLAYAFETFRNKTDRLLFVLREPNVGHMAADACDLRTIFAAPSAKLTHSTLALWAGAILDNHRNQPHRPGRDETAAMLKRVAIINVKKIGAGGIANAVSLSVHLWEFKSMLSEQIERLSPSTIIACGQNTNLLLYLAAQGLSAPPPPRHWTLKGIDVYACYHPARPCNTADALDDLNTARYVGHG